MSLAVFRKIIEESHGRVIEIKFIGLGEPALHPELDVMMRLLKVNGINATFYTNGTLFDRYSPAEICDWGLWRLIVSVDGTDERTFNRLRVGGNYWSLRANLADFRKFRDELGLRSPLIEIRHVMMPNETRTMLHSFQADWLNGLGDTVKYNSLGPPTTVAARKIRRDLLAGTFAARYTFDLTAEYRSVDTAAIMSGSPT
jgi:hypothetical protein